MLRKGLNSSPDKEQEKQKMFKIRYVECVYTISRSSIKTIKPLFANFLLIQNQFSGNTTKQY